MSHSATILGSQGPFSRHLAGFTVRHAQIEMAEEVERTLAKGGILICEAGTGTGKTFAYLVPALLSGHKLIVSTGTRNLQDQLFHRDLPLVRKALGMRATVALLKGRANYLCLHRLETAWGAGRLTPALEALLVQVQSWAGRTRSGDIAELSLPEDTPLWPWITSTTENCLGQTCPHWNSCHLVAARRRAQEADLVVVNHHLLCADLALKGEGYGDILPGADGFILDEAHQLPEVVSKFFGASLSGRQLLALAQDLEVEYRQEAGDAPDLLTQNRRLIKAVRELRLSLGVEPRRGSWAELLDNSEVAASLTGVAAELVTLRARLEALGSRGKGLDSCLARCADLALRLETLLNVEPGTDVRWFETQPQGFHLNRTPLDIAPLFSVHLQAQSAAWIFTSATLAVGDSFAHFAQQLGIEDAATRRWDSPFDYPRQALLFLPQGLPEPQGSTFNQAVARFTLPILEASEGRAFLLYTSHRALQEAASWLRERLPFPLLVQGTAPRGELLERFRRSGHGVLLGTASFWEGVDVRGEALSCVIIDKLPFASPGDPVLQARVDALRTQGINSFMEFQLPQAVIALKQGAGRLIRHSHDRGVLVICDPRLVTRSYGRTFLDSLPPMRQTRALEDVIAFFGGEQMDPP